MKRLIKKARHDIGTRDRAIAIINRVIYESDTHADCINNFYEDNDLDDYYLDSSITRPSFNKIERFVESIAFAHIVDSEKAIYLEWDSLQNIQLEDAAKIIKSKYPNYTIYNDDMRDSKLDFSTNEYVDSYQVIMAKIK